MPGSIVFVHGTGVRFDGYAANIRAARAQAAAAGLDAAIVPCGWGEALGISFAGLSLPVARTAEQIERDAEELARWSWLLDDPLSEVERLSIRGTRAAAVPSGKPAWVTSLERIKAYRPSLEAVALLERAGLADLWDVAAAAVGQSPLVRLAFERSAEAGELPDAIAATARATAAELHRRGIEDGRPAPSAEMRARLCRRLTEDWGGGVAGLSTFLPNILKRAGTAMLRRRRSGLNDAIAAPIGDILLYQSHGARIRELIRDTIEGAGEPVTLLAHSLGGIACVDLLASTDPPPVTKLVTIGSQAPFFHELGAMVALDAGAALPGGFPPCLNIFDRNDLLSFIGELIFPGRVTDVEVQSGQPFPDAHSAYVGNPEVWTTIAGFAPQ